MKNNALSKLSISADFKTRKMIGNGLIMSSISYIIQVYGACSGYLLDMLQVQQNIAACHITKNPYMTPTKTLLRQCDWLSIRQLIMYHSLVSFYKVLKVKKPEYMAKRVKYVERESRTTDRLTVIDSSARHFHTVTASRGYFPRTIKHWNSLPFSIRETENVTRFKCKLKNYIRDTIQVK